MMANMVLFAANKKDLPVMSPTVAIVIIAVCTRVIIFNRRIKKLDLIKEEINKGLLNKEIMEIKPYIEKLGDNYCVNYLGYERAYIWETKFMINTYILSIFTDNNGYGIITHLEVFNGNYN